MKKTMETREMVSDCSDCDSNGWVLIAHGGDTSHAWVERCDSCRLFDDDLEAAMWASIKMDKPIGFAWVDCGGVDGGHHQPYMVGEELG